MRPSDDPSEMSPKERRREVAAILAAGVLRWRKRRAEEPAETPPEITAKPVRKRLAVPRKTVLSGRSG